MLEAMALQCILVGTDIPGVPRAALGPNLVADLAAPEDPADLAAKILDALRRVEKDPDSSERRMADALRPRFESEFSIEECL